MKLTKILIIGMACLALFAGCSQQEDIATPNSNADSARSDYKNGTETLGVPSIAISGGSGFAEGGVGMVGVESGTLDITVPAGAEINQVLLYWAGGTTGADGDDEILVDGAAVTGELIGGPTFFFTSNGVSYYFSGYRADISDRKIVVAGANSFEISGFDFDNTGGTLDENNGASIVVIYDDGTAADIDLVDGLDMAFFQFNETLDATVPQDMLFGAEDADRTGQLLIIAGSVGAERPNVIKVTSSLGDEMFVDQLGSGSGLLWDSIILDVMVPANDTKLTVELISTKSEDPLGASLGWLASGLSVPSTPDPEPASIGDRLWIDTNMNGIQDDGEAGYNLSPVYLLDCLGNVLAETLTDADGFYLFDELDAGDYNIRFALPEGYVFTLQNIGNDDAVDSDADPATGVTVCTTLEPGENDMTWDAGVYLPEEFGCSLTIGFWKNHAGFGPQADVVTPLLPIWLGDAGATDSLAITTAGEAVLALQMKYYGGGKNGIAKLYAQMLATKLNIANGASGSDVTEALDMADAFLAEHSAGDWDSLSRSDKKMVLNWMSMFDSYNNGDIGPGHCD